MSIKDNKISLSEYAVYLYVDEELQGEKINYENINMHFGSYLCSIIKSENGKFASNEDVEDYWNNINLKLRQKYVNNYAIAVKSSQPLKGIQGIHFPQVNRLITKQLDRLETFRDNPQCDFNPDYEDYQLDVYYLKILQATTDFKCTAGLSISKWLTSRNGSLAWRIFEKALNELFHIDEPTSEKDEATSEHDKAQKYNKFAKKVYEKIIIPFNRKVKQREKEESVTKGKYGVLYVNCPSLKMLTPEEKNDILKKMINDEWERPEKRLEALSLGQRFLSGDYFNVIAPENSKKDNSESNWDSNDDESISDDINDSDSREGNNAAENSFYENPLTKKELLEIIDGLSEWLLMLYPNNKFTEAINNPSENESAVDKKRFSIPILLPLFSRYDKKIDNAKLLSDAIKGITYDQLSSENLSKSRQEFLKNLKLQSVE